MVTTGVTPLTKKPYPDFPLSWHPRGYWCKRIKGKFYYFGSRNGTPEEALNQFLEERDDLFAGRERRRSGSLSVSDLCNEFPNAKRRKVDSGEMNIRRWRDYDGGDEKRSAFTSRVLAVTEIDKLDDSAETSREADKLKQMEGRLRFYGKRKRVYLECTVSIEEGRIRQEYHAGTAGLVHLPCVHCLEYVAPERADLLGWQDVETEWLAEETADLQRANKRDPQKLASVQKELLEITAMDPELEEANTLLTEVRTLARERATNLLERARFFAETTLLLTSSRHFIGSPMR